MKPKLSKRGEYLEWRAPSGRGYSWEIDGAVTDDEEFLEFLTAVVAWKLKKADDKNWDEQWEAAKSTPRAGVTGGSVDGWDVLALKDRVKALEKAVQFIQARSTKAWNDTVIEIKRLEALERRATAAENSLSAAEDSLGALESRLDRAYIGFGEDD